MKTYGSYNNFSEFSALLENGRCEYLILRNFEELTGEEVFVAGHADIDILCSDSRLLLKTIGAEEAYPVKAKESNGIHFNILIKEKKAAVDVREVGDGYYCTAWQKDMLKRRVPFSGFYVMDPENLFYSLTYHAIVQKPALSKEYQSRLLGMSKELGLAIDAQCAEQSLLHHLESFMRKHGYMYTYCTDKHVPLRRKAVGLSKELIDKNMSLRMRHFFYDLRIRGIEFLVRVKHTLFR